MEQDEIESAVSNAQPSIKAAMHRLLKIMEVAKVAVAIQIKNAFDEIEEAQERGASLELIVKFLNENGIKVSLGYLKLIMARIRKERKKEIAKGVVLPTPSPSSISRIQESKSPVSVKRDTPSHEAEASPNATQPAANLKLADRIVKADLLADQAEFFQTRAPITQQERH